MVLSEWKGFIYDACKVQIKVRMASPQYPLVLTLLLFVADSSPCKRYFFFSGLFCEESTHNDMWKLIVITKMKTLRAKMGQTVL